MDHASRAISAAPLSGRPSGCFVRAARSALSIRFGTFDATQVRERLAKIMNDDDLRRYVL